MSNPPSYLPISKKYRAIIVNEAAIRPSAGIVAPSFCMVRTESTAMRHFYGGQHHYTVHFEEFFGETDPMQAYLQFVYLCKLFCPWGFELNKRYNEPFFGGFSHGIVKAPPEVGEFTVRIDDEVVEIVEKDSAHKIKYKVVTSKKVVHMNEIG